MGAWLVDEEGRDVFRGGIIETATSDRVASAEESLPDSLSGFGGAVDDANQVIRDFNNTNPFGMVADSGGTFVEDAHDVSKNYDPSNPDGSGGKKLKYVVLAVVAMVVLYLLRPLLEIGAEVAE